MARNRFITQNVNDIILTIFASVACTFKKLESCSVIINVNDFFTLFTMPFFTVILTSWMNCTKKKKKTLGPNFQAISRLIMILRKRIVTWISNGSHFVRLVTLQTPHPTLCKKKTKASIICTDCIVLNLDKFWTFFEIIPKLLCVFNLSEAKESMEFPAKMLSEIHQLIRVLDFKFLEASIWNCWEEWRILMVVIISRNLWYSVPVLCEVLGQL